MSDYISREAVKQIIAAQCGECADACLEFDGIQPDCNQCLLHGVLKELATIPAADVRPVVTCIECKYSCDMPGGLRCCYGNCVDCYVDPEYFCADGEKREES